MKEIITKVEKVVDATEPNKVSKILFKGFTTGYRLEQQNESISFTSYSVSEEEDAEGDMIEVLSVIRNHNDKISKEDLDSLAASLTIESVDYTDIRNEQTLKGAMVVISTRGLFGLTTDDLEIR